MCTYRTTTLEMAGSGKGAEGWFALTDASVYFDHPVHANAEHTLNIDLINPSRCAGARVAMELDPTAADIPPIRVFFEEEPYPFGPGGAKGIGELPMDGPAPAILNAIENATGICLRETPATPEVLMEALLESITEKAGARD